MRDDLLELAISAARDAGKAILGFYRKEMQVDHKADGSPLTLADKAAHQTIMQSLVSSGIPVVSEEGRDLMLDASRYWLVDPLDGTKDFLAQNNEFTVNIALVDGGRPLLGVVYAPALEELYVGAEWCAAWCESAGAKVSCSQAEKSAGLRVAVSRFHDHADVGFFADINSATESIPMGSALKYGRLALGVVDVFPRLVGSSEWDTGAGQAVLEAAGGSVLDWHTGQPLAYGKPLRRNPRLLSIRAPYRFTDFKLKHYEPELL